MEMINMNKDKIIVAFESLGEMVKANRESIILNNGVLLKLLDFQKDKIQKQRDGRKPTKEELENWRVEQHKKHAEIFASTENAIRHYVKNYDGGDPEFHEVCIKAIKEYDARKHKGDKIV